MAQGIYVRAATRLAPWGGPAQNDSQDVSGEAAGGKISEGCHEPRAG